MCTVHQNECIQLEKSSGPHCPGDPSYPANTGSSHSQLQPDREFLLTSLAANDSGPPQVNYGTEQPLAASTPRATQTSAGEIQPTDTYHQIIPGMSE